jgi:hypothetical protein
LKIKFLYSYKFKNFFFLKKNYENLNYLVLKKPNFFLNNYNTNLKKNIFVTYDDYISIHGNFLTKDKNLSEVLKFKVQGFNKNFLSFFEKRIELIKKYQFDKYDDLS